MVFPSLKIFIRPSKDIIKQIVTFSSKMFGIRINAFIYNGMDKFIIGIVLPLQALTTYAIASAIHAIANRITSLVSLPLMPAASSLKAEDDKLRLKKLFLKATKYTLAISTPATISLIILAKPLINIWMGNSYTYVAPLAQLFLSYLLINSLAPVAYNFLIGFNKAGFILKIQSISTIINLIVSVILVQYIGIAGVICGTIVGTSLAVFPYLYQTFKEIDVKFRGFFIETIWNVYSFIVVPTILLILLSKVKEPSSIFEIVLYAGIYYLCFFIPYFFWGVDKEDKEMVMLKIRKWRYKNVSNL